MTHNMKRWTITAMIMTVMLVAIVGTSSAAAPPAGWGNKIGSFTYNEVEVGAYSNGDVNYLGPYGTYGYQFQCVEYVNRFYVQALGHKNMKGGGNANQYFSTASSKGLVAYKNGGTTPPQMGDIICSNGNGAKNNYGHVAIVRQVLPDSIRVIQQNWVNLPATFPNQNANYFPLTMKVSGGKYTVGAFSSAYPVVGWLHKSGSNDVKPPVTLTVSPSSGQQGTIFTVSGNGYTPNGPVAYHVKKPDNTEFPVATLTASSSGVITYPYKSTTASMVGTYTIWAIDKSISRQSTNVQETITRSSKHLK